MSARRWSKEVSASPRSDPTPADSSSRSLPRWHDRRLRGSLAAFEIEDWLDREEDTETALGEPHHFHRVELVARRAR
jgi:hypothetical protein